MSERKTMKTFFAAMNEQIGMGGYGSKIKSTPMGPFKWNDLMQLWENVNNGMVMSNVSLQDMMAMDYGTESGDSGSAVACNYATAVFTTWTVSLEQSSGFTESSTYNFTNTCPITLTSELIDANADTLEIDYSVNGGAYVNYTITENISIPAAATFKIRVNPSSSALGLARFRFRNSTNNNDIVWAVSITVSPDPP